MAFRLLQVRQLYSAIFVSSLYFERIQRGFRNAHMNCFAICDVTVPREHIKRWRVENYARAVMHLPHNLMTEKHANCWKFASFRFVKST